MINHLVESHLDDYYVSSKNPKKIERECAVCGGRDKIIATYDSTNFDDQYNSILPCCYKASYLPYSGDEKEDFIVWLDDCGYEVIEENVQDDIIESFNEAKEFANKLEKKGYISDDVTNKLCETIEGREAYWLHLYSQYYGCVKKKFKKKTKTLN